LLNISLKSPSIIQGKSFLPCKSRM
jgi:hypothetical protein